MSQEILSALLDGECSPDELKRLLDAAGESPELMQRWSRMSAVREALAGGRVAPPASRDFCAGVMAALDEAPMAVTAAAARTAPPEVLRSASVMPLRRRRSRPLWQPLVGLAVAASIAAVAVVGARSWLLVPAGEQLAATGKVQTASLPAAGQAGLVPVANVAAGGEAEPADVRWGQLDADTARQLNEFLMEHSNLRADQGMGGSLSYARMTVRTTEYRTGEPR